MWPARRPREQPTRSHARRLREQAPRFYAGGFVSKHRDFTPATVKQAPSIGGLLDLQAQRDPHRPALSCENTTLTRAELAARVNRRARALQRAGVVEGDFVAIAL